ncbi:MAG: hypothetical protein Q8P30_00255 [Candidatus Uhrbacteria bacterium]|nr:hypothetical protein [Candidatus Uhrbacteria bacterium]
MRITFLFVVLTILGAGCVSESWNGFYYPEGCLSCEDSYIFSPTFDNYNDCYAWARDIALEQNLGSDLFECGQNCKHDPVYGSICKETIDDDLPVSSSAIEEQKIAEEEEMQNELREYQERLDAVLKNYKESSIEVSEWEESLFNSITANPSLVCFHIISTADGDKSNSHVYWQIMKEIDKLETEYAQYKDEIEYIDNNLNSHRGFIYLFVDECKKAGYTIPTYQAD